MKDYLKIITGVILAIALIFVIYQTAGNSLELEKIKTKNEAVDNCLQFAGQEEYENTKANTKGFYPMVENYKSCLQDKGYKSTWK